MPKNKAGKESGNATLAGVKKEMGKPRVAKSARKKYGNLALPVVLTEAGKALTRKAVQSHFDSELLKEVAKLNWEIIRETAARTAPQPTNYKSCSKSQDLAKISVKR